MPRFKKILLVNPPKVDQGGYTPSPLGLLYLASYLKNKGINNVCVVDAAIRGEKILRKKIVEFKPDLVGISCLTPGRHQALGVASYAKKINPNCKTVLGGIHPTLMWHQILSHYPQVDYIVRGEGEVTFFELVKGKKPADITGLVWKRYGKIINNPDRPLITDLNSIPLPAWDLVDPTTYPPWGIGIENGIDLTKETRYSIIFSRGCMGCCTFCSSWKVWKGYRYRSGLKVADEIESLVRQFGAKHFAFYDDTLTGNREEVINFCREIVKRKIRVAIHGTTRVDFVDAQLLSWMKKAGFYEISYGIESGSPSMLIKINKRTDLEKIKRTAKLTKKAKIKLCALMMFGLPRETREDKEESLKLLRQIKPDDIGTVGEVWIFPGTALYEQAKNALLIDDRFWLSRKPYYIYRGGIGGDPINYFQRFKDQVIYLSSYTPLENQVSVFFIRLERLYRRIVRNN